MSNLQTEAVKPFVKNGLKNPSRASRLKIVRGLYRNCLRYLLKGRSENLKRGIFRTSINS